MVSSTSTSSLSSSWCWWWSLDPARKILGVGFWVQGLRCFPWMAVSFFLKDGLRVDPSTLQLLLTSANIPMIGKPLYGLLSDALYFKAQHRIPYIAFGGASIAEVANDAIVAEKGKQPSKGSTSSSIGELQSFVSIAASIGGVLGNLLGGFAISRYSPQAMFLFYGLLLAFQFLVTITVRESSLNLPKASSNVGIKNQLSELLLALRKPEIARSIAWLAASYALVPFVSGTMFFYQTQHLKIDSSVLGISKLFAQAAMLLWSIIYNCHLKSVPARKLIAALQALMAVLMIARSIAWLAASYALVPFVSGTMFFYQTQHLKIDSSVLGISKLFAQAAMLLWSIIYNCHLKSVPARKLIAALQALMAVLMVSDAMFVKGIYREMGVPDAFYVVLLSGLLEVLVFFKMLPFNVLIAQLCPPGCEGSLMALVASAVALALITSGYLGVALASYAGITGDDFSGFPRALLIQAACTVLPIYWSSCVPDDKKPKTENKDK
ncbi:hypothetical protein Tsubulata_043466 [Turnera subulata]|uniref:Folate-biopterin transporter 7 n=1 Tax=Turnera subulata TaxID=218843 RepID=A0A9Q0FN18_9ROSI|nr:hypothetical protein Tsubulata_043466 [Turnera subulata]